jgi:hypothetical protein
LGAWGWWRIGRCPSTEGHPGTPVWRHAKAFDYSSPMLPHVEDSIYMARVHLEHFGQGFKLSTLCFWKHPDRGQPGVALRFMSSRCISLLGSNITFGFGCQGVLCFGRRSVFSPRGSAISSCMWLDSSTLICAVVLRAGRKQVGKAAKSQLDDCNQQMQEWGADHKHRADFFENYDLL